MTATEALALVRKKISNGYQERFISGPRDYPPFAPTSPGDRARYHRYILGVIDETLREVAADAPRESA